MRIQFQFNDNDHEPVLYYGHNSHFTSDEIHEWLSSVIKVLNVLWEKKMTQERIGVEEVSR